MQANDHLIRTKEK